MLSITTDVGLPPAGLSTPPRSPRRVAWSRDDVSGSTAAIRGTLVASINSGPYQSGVADWDLRTGRLRWRQVDPAAFPMQIVTTATTVTAILGSVDTQSAARISEARVVHGFDLATGRLLWSRPVPRTRDPGGPDAQLAVSGDSVLIAAGRSSVTAVDSRTGRARWTSTGAGTCSMRAGAIVDRDYPGPLAADSATTVIARSCGPTAVDVLDSATGAYRWSWPESDGAFQISQAGAAVAGLVDGVVFVSAAITRLPAATRVTSFLRRQGIAPTPLLALDARSGSLLWSEPDALIGTVVADGPRAACLMSSGGYECRDAHTGRLLFTPTEFDPGVAVYGSAFNAVVAFPFLYRLEPLGGDGVRLTTRNSITGRLLATYQLPGWKWSVRINGYHPAVVAAAAGAVLLQRTDADPEFPLVAYR